MILVYARVPLSAKALWREPRGFDERWQAEPRLNPLGTAWTAVGPAQIASQSYGLVTGRVTSVAIDPADASGNTVYVGTTGGGVWKTTDAGHSWSNISDGFFSVASIGAVEVALSDSNVVYVGTGSSKIRSNISIGHGMYRSADAGKTWKFIGLSDAGQIAEVRVHPKDPNTVYVAAQGNPFVPNEERGVFRTNDGGKT